MAIVDNAPSRLVSARLDQQHGVSAFGTLLHLARLNHFHGPDFRAAFGLHFHYRDDLSKLLAFSAKNQAQLAAASGISQESRDVWSVEPWQPFTEHGLWTNLPWSLRACPSCLRSGYHSNLFQMPWMAQCPWHRTKLIRDCRKCGRPLLEGFRQGHDLMHCLCGGDSVNERAILKGDPHQVERADFIEAYLSWTRSERECVTLLFPEHHDAGGADALAALWSPPKCLSHWRHSFIEAPPHVHLDRLYRRTAKLLSDRLYADMVRCANSLWPGQAGMADLPSDFLGPLVGVTRQIASSLPATCLTTREQEALALEPTISTAATPSRHDLLLLPVQRVANGLYLDVRVLHGAAYQVIGNLGWHLVTNDPARAYPASGSHRLLLVAVRQALCRAYADGFKHVLGRHVPALYDQPRLKAGQCLPWVLMRRDSMGTQSLAIAWSRRQPWESGAKPVTRGRKLP